MHLLSRASRPIKVANVSYIRLQPYRMLAELDCVVYEENLPPENARKLHENEVDIALIPASEFALHGGYVGLDHGLVCSGRSDSVYLCAHQPIRSLETIYLFGGAASSAVLLRLLLRERWGASPRLVRSPVARLPETLRENEGVLCLDEALTNEHLRLPVAVDLVEEWGRLTNRPFTFLVWAVRPHRLGVKTVRAFQEMFHRSVVAADSLILQNAARFGLTTDQARRIVGFPYQYYFDDRTREGLNAFFYKAADLGMLPLCRYRNATFTLLDNRQFGSLREPSVGDLLEATVNGRRLSLRDGERIASEASLGDLTLAAEAAQRRRTPQRTVERCTVIPCADLQRGNYPHSQTSEEGGAHRIVIPDVEEQLSQYLEHVERLRRVNPTAIIEGPSTDEITAWSDQSGLPIETVIVRLQRAGVTRLRTGSSSNRWLEIIRVAHRFGIRSTALLPVMRNDSWSDRVLHLNRLRQIQDETGGFDCCAIALEGEKQGSESAKNLRALCLLRLFMDNVPLLEERWDGEVIPATLIGTEVGVSRVVVQSESARRLADACIFEAELSL